jgi:multidrug resistance protein, MATE family
LSNLSPFSRVWHGRSLRKEIAITLKLALPLMMGELSSMLMGVVGTMMTGQLGETSLAASGIASVVYVMSMLLIWGGIRMIPTPVAEAHELRNGTSMRTLVYAGGFLSLFFIIVCSSLLWLGILNFDLMQQDPEVGRLAVGYLRIIAYSMPVLVLFSVMINYIDALGYVKFTMFLSIFGLILDVSLNWLFIFGHLGMPKLGLNAIAMNTGITHLVLTIIMFGMLLLQKELAYIWEAKTDFKAVWEQTVSFIKVAIPSALQIMVEFAAFAAGTVIIGQISKTEQAAHQIAINLISVTYVTIMGISTAGMIRVGQALAYNSRIRIWLAGIATITLAMLFMVVPTVAFLLFPKSIASLYIEDPLVVSIATALLLFAGLFQMADAIQASSISLLRALNDVTRPSILSFIAFWLIGIPLGYWLAVHQGWNAKGIWVGYLVALLVQAAFFLRRFFHLVAHFDMSAKRNNEVHP